MLVLLRIRLLRVLWVMVSWCLRLQKSLVCISWVPLPFVWKWELCQAVVFHRNVGISPCFPLSSCRLPLELLEQRGSWEQWLLPVLVWDNSDAPPDGSPGPYSSFCNSVASFKDLFLIEFFIFLCLTVHLLFLVLSQGCVRLCSEQYSCMVLQDSFFLLHLYFILYHLFVVWLMAGCYFLMYFHSSFNQPEQCMIILKHFCCCFLNFLYLIALWCLFPSPALQLLKFWAVHCKLLPVVLLVFWVLGFFLRSCDELHVSGTLFYKSRF